MNELAEGLSVPETRAHNADFHGWTSDQVSLIQQRQFDAVDWQNVIEELMAAARNEERALGSQFERFLLHLLKWQYQPDKRSGSWEAPIVDARRKIDKALRRSPSLKSELDETFRDAYQTARLYAGAEMGWRKARWERELPEKCPWTLDQIRSDFWPDD
ncbi:MAG TPA: DUF29 domain-containing protein [Candidatus Binataceae bacterium]|nr:DUF29 domain-containing protein [Candidatus Binataceae bacterium]